MLRPTDWSNSLPLCSKSFMSGLLKKGLKNVLIFRLKQYNKFFICHQNGVTIMTIPMKYQKNDWHYWGRWKAPILFHSLWITHTSQPIMQFPLPHLLGNVMIIDHTYYYREKD